MSLLPKLLLIEDNRAVADPLSQALRTAYDVEAVPTGEAGLLKADNDYTAIILELNLPDLSGLVVCETLRGRGVSAPILIVSSDSSVLTKIKLLDAGADDYLIKPFSLGELKARLRVLDRRISVTGHNHRQLVVGDIVLDAGSRTVTRAGLPINLRRKEFAILECLMLRAGSVVNREVLAHYAWQGGDDGWTNTIDVHIKYLRDKIDRPFGGNMIKTVHGLGYRLEAADAPVTANALLAPVP